MFFVPHPDKKKPHIKKPLNAFMLYMKEMRAKVVAECTLKESAAINQILGRRVSGAEKVENPILDPIPLNSKYHHSLLTAICGAKLSVAVNQNNFF
jgi:hypothetical protein